MTVPVDIPYEVLDAALARFTLNRQPVFIVWDGEDWQMGSEPVDVARAVICIPQAA